MYEFGRINKDGSKQIIGFVNLISGGKIEGYTHFNETSWETNKDGFIVFKNANGEPTTVFNEVEEDTEISGEWEVENIETHVKEKWFFYDNNMLATESGIKAKWKEDAGNIIVEWADGTVETFNKS